MSLADLLAAKATATGIEGWVATDATGRMFKVKTDWYNTLHGTISEIREDRIVELVLNEQIDDLLSTLSIDSEKRVQVLAIQSTVDTIFNSLVVAYKDLRHKYFNEFSEDRKAFAAAHLSNPVFPLVMKTLHAKFTELEQVAQSTVKAYILHKCRTLQATKEFLVLQ
jgi:hypothetical protein